MLAPLAILTRPEGQAEWLAQQLRHAGWVTRQWPALQLRTREARDVPDPADFDLVMFVSGNAVRHFREQRQRLGSTTWPPHTAIAVVGPASAEVAATLGNGLTIWQPAPDSQEYDSEALWARLQACDVRPQRVLIVRGGAVGQAAGQGRSWLAERWREQGTQVTLHSAYERTSAVWPHSHWHRLAEDTARGRRIDWLFTSSEGVAAVVNQRGLQDLVACWRGQRIIVTHPRIAMAVMEYAQRGGLATDSGLASQAVQRHPELVIQVCVSHDQAVLAAFVN